MANMPLWLSILKYFVLVIFGCCCLITVCSQMSTSPTVRYVLPNGFRGKFVVVVNERDGQKININDPVQVIRVSPNGVAKVNSDPLLAWHRTEAVFENGSTLAIASGDESDRKDKVYLWSLVLANNKEALCVVGTKSEMEAARRSWDR